MDERIQELYIKELENDIKDKIIEKGYEVTKCKVYANISENNNEANINKIKLYIRKSENYEEDKKKENTKLENKIVTEIQKIKKIDTTIKVDNNEKKDDNISVKFEENENNEIKRLTKIEIQNIKKFLIEEYGVSEKCLEIN